MNQSVWVYLMLHIMEIFSVIWINNESLSIYRLKSYSSLGEKNWIPFSEVFMISISTTANKCCIHENNQNDLRKPSKILIRLIKFKYINIFFPRNISLPLTFPHRKALCLYPYLFILNESKRRKIVQTQKDREFNDKKKFSAQISV